MGLTMQLWNQRRLPELAGSIKRRAAAARIEDVYDARHVAQHLGIPYYVVNFEQRFEEQVVKPFIDEYLAGRTPIPCTLCNNFIKFDQFLEMAEGRARRASPPDTTRGSASMTRAGAGNCAAAWTRSRIKPISCSA